MSDTVHKRQFAIVPMWVHRRILGTGTRTAALAVYVELVGQYAGNAEDAEGLRVWPEVQQIADSMGIPKRNVERALGVLIDCGVVLKKRTVRRNQYWLPQEPPDEFVSMLTEFSSATSGGLDSVQTASSGGPRSATSGGFPSATSGGLYNPDPITQTQETLSLAPAVPQEPARASTAEAERENNEARNRNNPNNDGVSQVAAAWAAARGGHRNPDAEQRIRDTAGPLLNSGWPLAEVKALAVDMAHRHPTWTDLGRHAMHQTPPTPPADDRAGRPTHCGHPDCHPGTRMRTTEQGDGSDVVMRCPECHPQRTAA